MTNDQNRRHSLQGYYPLHRELDLLKVRGIYDEESGAMMSGFGGTARVPEYINDGLHLLLLHADE